MSHTAGVASSLLVEEDSRSRTDVRMEAARKPDDPSSCGARRRPLYPRSRFPPVVGRHPRRLETTRHEDLQPPQWSAKSRSTGTHSPPTPSRISRSSSTRQSQGRLPNRRSETLRRGRPRRSIPPFMGLSRRDAGQRADNRLVKAHPCQLGHEGALRSRPSPYQVVFDPWRIGADLSPNGRFRRRPFT